MIDSIINIYNFIFFVVFIFPAYFIFLMTKNYWKFKKPTLFFLISYFVLCFIFFIWDYYDTRTTCFYNVEYTLNLNLSNGKVESYDYVTTDLQDFKYHFKISFDSTSFIEIEKQVSNSSNNHWEKLNEVYIYKGKSNYIPSDVIYAEIDSKKRVLHFTLVHI